MYCFKKRIYCHDCNRSYIDSNYPNYLRSKGNLNNVMKKRCCSCNIATTQEKLCCNDHDLTCCISNLSLNSDSIIEIDFTDNQSDRYKNIDPYLLLKLSKKNILIVLMTTIQM